MQLLSSQPRKQGFQDILGGACPASRASPAKGGRRGKKQRAAPGKVKPSGWRLSTLGKRPRQSSSQPPGVQPAALLAAVVPQERDDDAISDGVESDEGVPSAAPASAAAAAHPVLQAAQRQAQTAAASRQTLPRQSTRHKVRDGGARVSLVAAARTTTSAETMRAWLPTAGRPQCPLELRLHAPLQQRPDEGNAAAYTTADTAKARATTAAVRAILARPAAATPASLGQAFKRQHRQLRPGSIPEEQPADDVIDDLEALQQTEDAGEVAETPQPIGSPAAYAEDSAHLSRSAPPTAEAAHLVGAGASVSDAAAVTPILRRSECVTPRLKHASGASQAPTELEASTVAVSMEATTPEFPGLAQQNQARAQLMSALPRLRNSGPLPKKSGGRRGSTAKGGVLGQRLDHAKVQRTCHICRTALLTRSDAVMQTQRRHCRREWHGSSMKQWHHRWRHSSSAPTCTSASCSPRSSKGISSSCSVQ